MKSLPPKPAPSEDGRNLLTKSSPFMCLSAHLETQACERSESLNPFFQETMPNHVAAFTVIMYFSNWKACRQEVFWCSESSYLLPY